MADVGAAPEFAGLRVLLVHQWLYVWAGAERCLEQFVELIPHADLLAGIVTPEMRALHPIAARARESWVGRLPGARRHQPWFLPLHPLAFASVDTSAYDLVISLSHAFEKSVRATKHGAVHVSYCFSPPRHLWDLNDQYRQLASPLERTMLRAATPALRAMDLAFARRVDHFVSISQFVADRVRRWYGRPSAVVYPPVSAKRAAHDTAGPASAREPFLLTVGRLVSYKRVDLAVRAADRLGIRLVVAGDGPERPRLERIAGRNVDFVGEVSEAEAARLLSRCAAFVFCAEEDFGIAPVEANAHGAPVVAFGRGGVMETLREGETAVFFQQQTVDAVCAAIERCLATQWDAEVLRRNAERFSPSRFREGIRGELTAALSR